MYKLFEHIKKNYIALLLYAFLIVFTGLIQTQKSNYHLDEILTLNLSNGVFPNYFKPLKVYQPANDAYQDILSVQKNNPRMPLFTTLSLTASRAIQHPRIKTILPKSRFYSHFPWLFS